MKKKILVVIANYYTNIADELLKSALNELKNIHQQQGNNFSDLSRNLKSWSTSQRKKFRNPNDRSL